MIKVVKGFTLIELLVVVLIIVILAAVALPQYQKAVLKSRYTSMMPIGKAIANGNEVYYMEHGAYASAPTQLDITGQSAKYPDGTQVFLSPTTDTALSYVLVTNDRVPNARYLVYQKHSPSFADTTMCEAGDTRANELCQALGGVTLPSGGNSVGNSDWMAYVLSGTVDSHSTFVTASNCEGNPLISGGSGSPHATRTAECDSESGKWVYGPWTGSTEYSSGTYSPDSAYEYTGATFSSRGKCQATVANGCSGALFKGYATCGGAENGCSDSSFSGNAQCRASRLNACADTTYTDNACCEDWGGGCPANAPRC